MACSRECLLETHPCSPSCRECPCRRTAPCVVLSLVHLVCLLESLSSSASAECLSVLLHSFWSARLMHVCLFCGLPLFLPPCASCLKAYVCSTMNAGLSLSVAHASLCVVSFHLHVSQTSFCAGTSSHLACCIYNYLWDSRSFACVRAYVRVCVCVGMRLWVDLSLCLYVFLLPGAN